MQLGAPEQTTEELRGLVSRYSDDILMERRRFYDLRIASLLRTPARSYHELIAKEFMAIIPAGSQVLEIGCAFGDLLAAVKPSLGLGVDFCPVAIAAAQQLHPELEFRVGEATGLTFSCQLDYIILSDLINDLPDVQPDEKKLRPQFREKSQ